MASHVVVVDSAARRATIKTLPEKYLTDVLREACEKLGRDADSYTLKHKTKTIDLSLTFRLSGLASGAKLELVLSSRSPSAVSVALQFSQSDSQGTNRLTDKLSSDTTLWMILRHFESKVDGVKRNFTGRGVPISVTETRNSGRLFYETPVIQVMSRELSSFTDLQKTLAHLGFNDGSTLLRLRFKVTETPLEMAMQQISEYFGHLEDREAVLQKNIGSELTLHATEKLVAPANENDLPPSSVSDPTDSRRQATNTVNMLDTAEMNGDLQASTILSGDLNARALTIFAPPSSNTPQAAQEEFDERDFVPTIAHARSHQSRLSATGTNKRLLSDAELIAQAEEQRRGAEMFQEVEIKLRFPDQMQTICKFSKDDSANTLYDFVRELMAREDEPFTLRFSAPKGFRRIPRGDKGNVKLIGELGMIGRTLVNVVWDEGASMEARQGPVLKGHIRDKAQEIRVKKIEATADESQPPPTTESKSKEEKERKGGIPKWLKLPSKK